METVTGRLKEMAIIDVSLFSQHETGPSGPMASLLFLADLDQRVVTHGDGWMAMNAPGDPPLEDRIGRLHAYADELDRDPATIGMQMSLSPDAIDKDARKRFYAEPELILARCLELKALGFDHVNIDCVPIFQQGFRTSETMLEHLDAIYRTLKAELP